MHQVHELVSPPSEVFVDHIDAPPLGISTLIVQLSSSVSMESLIQHVINIDFKSGIEAISLHVLSAKSVNVSEILTLHIRKS